MNSFSAERTWLALTRAALLICVVLSASFASRGQSSLPTLTTVHYFASGTDGQGPNELLLGTDGYLYGTSYAGGTNWNPAVDMDCGTVFKMDTNGNLIWAVSLAGTNGSSPAAGLVQASDSNFYGTTWFGGAHGCGTIFRISPNGALTSLFSFNGTNGWEPGRLVQAKNGLFYGTTALGGADCTTLDLSWPFGKGSGTVFTISTGGAFTNLLSFSGTNGASPNGPLLDGGDGSFYGTTAAGGDAGNGTIFKVTAGGMLTPLYSFTGGADGSTPVGALLRANDGKLYGVAGNGGPYATVYIYGGTLFRFETNGTLTTQAYFDGTNGATPNCIMQGRDGAFYGTTRFGGTFTNEFGSEPPFIGVISYSYGTIFKLTSGGNISTVLSLNLTNGIEPEGLFQVSDGSFYGATWSGGTNGFFYQLFSGFAGGGDGTVFHLTLPPVRPEFSSVVVIGPNVELTWNAETGAVYQLQYKKSITQAMWEDLGSALPATNINMSVSDFTGTTPQRFYRLVKIR